MMSTTPRSFALAALAAVSLAFGGAALAKGPHDDRDHGPGKHGRHGKGHEKARGKGHMKHHGPPPHAQAGGRGAGPQQNFYRGGQLPVEYRDRGYWVEDWRGHRLSAPPRGYHWVQTGSDYVLVAPSNVIFQVVLGQ